MQLEGKRFLVIGGAGLIGSHTVDALKLASSFGKVVLSGAGGDELFAGYPWRYYQALKSASFAQYVDCYYAYWQRLLSDGELSELLRPLEVGLDRTRNYNTFRGIFPDRLRMDAGQYVNNSLYLEAKTFLHGLSLLEDKLSMAQSLEVRVPMLDNDLVDYAMRIPTSYKLKVQDQSTRVDENAINKKMASQSRVGKCILRKLLNRYVPPQMTQFKKQGFSAPDASWFRGESIDYVRSVVENKNNPLYDYVAPTVLRELVGEHLSGKKNRRLLVCLFYILVNGLNSLRLKVLVSMMSIHLKKYLGERYLALIMDW